MSITRGAWLMALSLAVVGCDRAREAKPGVAVAPPARSAVAADVVVGHRHTCVLLTNGEVRCWGSNDDGQLGQGHTQASRIPVSVPLGGTAEAISGHGASHTCALMTGGGVRCWGQGGDGQLGYGSTKNVGDDERPTDAGDVPLGEPAVAVRAMNGNTCVLLRSGAARCWGQLVKGRQGVHEGVAYVGAARPVQSYKAVSFPSPIREVVGACALLMNGETYCWRLSVVGDEATEPYMVADGSDPGVRLTPEASCVVTQSGRVRCWQEYTDFEFDEPKPVLPPQNNDQDGAPVTAVDIPIAVPVAQLFLDSQTTCFLSPAGEAYCTGDGRRGALGVPGVDYATMQRPARVDVGAHVVKMDSSGLRTCVVTDAGGVRCWGLGGDGALGYRTDEDVGATRTPAQAGDVPLGQ